ncbi:hypothetical protein AUEXF2481DRAFT_2482 [Aureobasidium subglaciale EXF-2481]|uniref:Uncharacterized protein n=1 Tax=Aureobasidium subglaciale (strain EXF-2481) TaxID=1043005 RepID=A0A074YL60_AURSE|nr:uncharacterized protein AUEXF2481DRAFT_2482 [Aureobasidium subglaciale EXF-2481]KEQ98548.1 hypothetical protein AUEXF2481DRAFT_2482 [Aureobasidium subglaciale EXF-2481]
MSNHMLAICESHKRAGGKTATRPSVSNAKHGKLKMKIEAEEAREPSTPLPIRDVSGEENQECNTSDDAAFVFDANLVSTSVFGPYGAFNKAPEPPL